MAEKSSLKSTIAVSLNNYLDAGAIVAGASGLTLWQNYLGLSEVHLGWLNFISANCLGAALGAIIGGFLADKYGRKFIYTYNLLVYMLGVLLVMLSVNFPMLLAGFLITGISVGIGVPASWTYISESSEVSNRGRNICISQMSWGFGPMIILLLGMLFAPGGYLFEWVEGLSAAILGDGAATPAVNVFSSRIVFFSLFIVAFIAWNLQRGLEESAEWKASKESAKAKGEDTYYLVWTTTPWTLPSNVALCVNPVDTYCKVKAADGYTYILAEALLDTVLGKLKTDDAPAYEIIEKFIGTDLEGKEYEPLYECAGIAAEKQHKKAHFVTCDNYVTMSDGTGIVHIAPAFGEDDSRIGRNYDLPFVQFVDGKGNLTPDTPYGGIFVKKADPIILEDLKNSGKLYEAPKFEHEYPHCWRCDTPLIYYARESWYIKETAVRDDLIRNNNTVNWIPESIGKGRFGNWLENIQDWAISRNRYWGTPLNIWECECGHKHCVGSVAELKEMSDNCPDEPELHRPYIDEVTIKCPECGGVMHRVPEVLDCWFDSGSMPFAQHHYPFENKELFEDQFPADFISEAVDQTRGWFHSLMAISTLLFNKAPYKNVIVLGHVQDEKGQKMSKSKGNAVDPFDALNTYGADAIRWYFYTNSAPWLPSKFSGKAVVEGQRKFMGTLWNTYAFWVLYADIDNFDPTKYDLSKLPLTVMDKYALSRLNSAVRDTDRYLSEYKIPEAAKALFDYVDELSNWYVRRCRERFWVTGMPDDKAAAYMTLYTCLVTIAKASAPMIPFMTEDIYQNLVRTVDASAPESIHLCTFPECDETMIDAELESSMKTVVDVVVLGRSARNGSNIKNRQPLSAMYVCSDSELDEFFTDIIRDELNVKSVSFVKDASALSTYEFKPQLRTVGPKYGKFLGQIRAALDPANLDGNAAKRELDENGKLTFTFGADTVELTEEDLLISIAQKEGFFCVEDHGITVALDTTLTPELIDEGFVRELISKIQTMRKDSDFVVTDKITIYADAGEKITEIVGKYSDKILPAVLGREIILTHDLPEDAKEWDINGENVRLHLVR